jgi:hypothetical protein
MPSLEDSLGFGEIHVGKWGDPWEEWVWVTNSEGHPKQIRRER